jgi:hypothetical protein
VAKIKAKPYTKLIRNLMAENSAILSKAQAFAQMGMAETALPLWESAGSYEERIAPLLDTLGRELEAAVHRISAASCFQKAGDLTRAVNLYRAVLAGPLRENTRRDVEQMLSGCLTRLTRSSGKSIGKITSK